MQGPERIRFERFADAVHVNFEAWGVAFGNDSSIVD
jgi:hypothetical protein